VATSQNGYSANDRSVIASYTVPGTTLKIALRKGDVSVVLLDYLRRYNAEVEPLTHVPQDLWGYAERTIRGDSATLSNHASSSAVDCRATRHGLGMTGTFTAAELSRLDNVEVRQLHVNANALHQKVDALAERVGQLSSGHGSVAPTTGPASLTDADVNRIATRVIDLLSERTRS
jgi:hypothetical protein